MSIQESKPTETLLKSFCSYYTERRLDDLLELFSPQVTLWGTARDEFRIGIEELKEQIQRDWSQASKGALEIVSWINTPNNASWAAAVCKTNLTIDGKDYAFEDLRGTIIATEENGELKILHMHCSFPDIRNPEGASFPVK